MMIAANQLDHCSQIAPIKKILFWPFSGLFDLSDMIVPRTGPVLDMVFLFTCTTGAPKPRCPVIETKTLPVKSLAIYLVTSSYITYVMNI